MKKSVLMIALAFGASSAFAQDLTSKKGEPILPEAEDWAISFDATPVFNYLGNAFSGATATNSATPSVNWLNSNQTIIGKQFIDEKSAYRVLVRLGFTNQSYKNNVSDNSVATPPAFPAAPPIVTDKFKNKATNIAIGVGKEMRRGKTRLQGFYGADAMIWIAMSSQKYEYGNTITAVPTGPGQTATPTSTTWTTAGVGTAAPMGGAGRILSNKSGMTFGLGVRGFVGAEYFIFPKISIGAEYGWGIGFQMAGKGKQTVENTGPSGSTSIVGETETETAGSSKFGFDTDLNQGTIFGFKGSNSGSATVRATFHF